VILAVFEFVAFYTKTHISIEVVYIIDN